MARKNESPQKTATREMMCSCLKEIDNSRNGYSRKTMHTSYGDIESHSKELYDMDISDSTISRITDFDVFAVV